MDEILNENLESEIPVEETEIESEISNEILNERVNPFCVISKNTFGEYAVRDIQTNSAWSENPYVEDYAVVPDAMVTDILGTRGFVDIELNEDGTEVVAFTPLEVPDIPEPPHEPTQAERIVELEETVEAQDASIYELTEYQAELLFEISLLQLGITE